MKMSHGENIPVLHKKSFGKEWNKGTHNFDLFWHQDDEKVTLERPYLSKTTTFSTKEAFEMITGLLDFLYTTDKQVLLKLVEIYIFRKNLLGTLHIRLDWFTCPSVYPVVKDYAENERKIHACVDRTWMIQHLAKRVMYDWEKLVRTDSNYLDISDLKKYMAHWHAANLNPGNVK